MRMSCDSVVLCTSFFGHVPCIIDLALLFFFLHEHVDVDVDVDVPVYIHTCLLLALL